MCDPAAQARQLPERVMPAVNIIKTKVVPCVAASSAVRVMNAVLARAAYIAMIAVSRLGHRRLSVSLRRDPQPRREPGSPGQPRSGRGHARQFAGCRRRRGRPWRRHHGACRDRRGRACARHGRAAAPRAFDEDAIAPLARRRPVPPRRSERQARSPGSHSWPGPWTGAAGSRTRASPGASPFDGAVAWPGSRIRDGEVRIQAAGDLFAIAVEEVQEHRGGKHGEQRAAGPGQAAKRAEGPRHPPGGRLP